MTDTTGLAALSEAATAGRRAVKDLYMRKPGHSGREADLVFAKAVVEDKVRSGTLVLRAEVDRARAEGAAEIKRFREAGSVILERMSSTYTARNGREVGIQGDDGEKVWLVHSDDIENLRAIVTDTTDAE
jgi:hypothetical protein